MSKDNTVYDYNVDGQEPCKESGEFDMKVIFWLLPSLSLFEKDTTEV